MSVPVWVERANGKFVASAVGHPAVRAEADTREAALAAVQDQLDARTAAGELVFLDVEPKGLQSLAGKYKGDRSLKEIVAEAYRYRDELKAREFPE